MCGPLDPVVLHGVRPGRRQPLHVRDPHQAVRTAVEQHGRGEPVHHAVGVGGVELLPALQHGRPRHRPGQRQQPVTPGVVPDQGAPFQRRGIEDHPARKAQRYRNKARVRPPPRRKAQQPSPPATRAGGAHRCFQVHFWALRRYTPCWVRGAPCALRSVMVKLDRPSRAKVGRMRRAFWRVPLFPCVTITPSVPAASPSGPTGRVQPAPARHASVPVKPGSPGRRCWTASPDPSAACHCTARMTVRRVCSKTGPSWANDRTPAGSSHSSPCTSARVVPGVRSG